MTSKPRITEATAERYADSRVQARLRTDGAYRNAENAEQQAARENEIEEAVWASLREQYDIADDDQGGNR